ncbi:MAG: OmpH family outer membrane protein [Zoogloeaceae bacterium]|jgi:outer membrane protein|nr:OmpH family outer membrane protein [Zoogloeaceae bacterium]
MLNTKSVIAASLCAGALILSVAPSAEAADLKVGYVDTQRIFRNAPTAVQAAKDIEKEFSGRDQELQKMAKKLSGMQENMEKNAVTMSESERRNKEREYADLSREFQRKQREFREDLSLRQNEANTAIIEKANKAIRQIADAEKFDLILQDVVWVSPRLDITEKVVKALSDGK